MIGRREMIGSALLGSLVTDSAAPAGQSSERNNDDIVRAIRELRGAIEAQDSFAEIAPVRVKLFEFVRAQQKFPDFIDVGLDVWVAVHDWHVKHLQPLTIGRDGNGRYTISLLGTAVVLRPENVPAFIGVPYDSR
jgi:hypothetical protein